MGYTWRLMEGKRPIQSKKKAAVSDDERPFLFVP
jgi:hypothetical protein